jgi:hypothetical protein
MYSPVSSADIIARIEHIRELHRQVDRLRDRRRLAHDRREQKIRDFTSNLRRAGDRPMANMVRSLEDICSLTTDGAHRLFGYELDGVSDFDFHLNGSRTHIVESYVFDRDLMVELPLELAPEDAFRLTGQCAESPSLAPSRDVLCAHRYRGQSRIEHSAGSNGTCGAR